MFLLELGSPSAHIASDFWFRMELLLTFSVPRFALRLSLFILKLRRYKLK